MTYNKTSHLVIVPTYNEVKNIEKFLNKLLQFDVSVLVVDDNSPDGTSDVVSKMSEIYENIYLKNRYFINMDGFRPGITSINLAMVSTFVVYP